MLQDLIHIVSGNVFLVFAGAILLHLLFNRYCNGLSRFDGPYVSSLSSLGTLYQTWRDGTVLPYLHLHQKYGNVVRVGPAKLSFSQPQAVRDIYGVHGLNQKSDSHLAHQQIADGVAKKTLFASTDLKWHNNVRRCVASAYSMTSMVQYEAYVDDATRVLIQQLESRFINEAAGNDAVVDFPKWMHFFTDDTINAIAYGKRIGHMEAGEDIEGLLAFSDMDSRSAILFSQAVWLQFFGRRNPLYMWLQRRGWYREKEMPLSIRFASKHQEERRRILAMRKETWESEHQQPELATLTDKFIHASEAHPDVLGSDEVLAMGLSIVAAGSDTTSISLSALFYYILKNNACYHKLVKEIDRSHALDENSLLSFASAQKLPYLSACIKETLRMHPATRYAPERVTPPNGYNIAGEHIPGNTVVFVSAWVIHRNEAIYGEDADMFRPERWIEANPGRLKEMERMLSTFGSGGDHTCLGKNVALLEMYKVVPALLRRFKILLARPNDEWKIRLGTFVSVTNFSVRLGKR